MNKYPNWVVEVILPMVCIFMTFIVVMAGIASYDSIYAHNIKAALDVCEPNGGVFSVDRQLNELQVRCTNGAYFELPVTKRIIVNV